jgi:LPXTG-motif cell wall-anchored protein
MRSGGSGSHTFTQAGTYTFHCTPHPFMKGTVVVVASSSGAGGGGGNATGSANGSGSGASAGTGASSSGSTSADTGSGTSGSNLPATGADIGAVALLGAVLVGGGMVLRRRVAGER